MSALAVPYVNAARAAAFRTYPHAAGVEDMTVQLMLAGGTGLRSKTLEQFQHRPRQLEWKMT
jgi:hypothetical protein